jgi:hypothetical protein
MVAKIDINAVRDLLTHEVMLELIDFEGARDDYKQLQKRLSDAGGEDRDLLRKAELLERQAKAAESDLENMARSPTVRQSEINDELKRIETMRDDARGLRFTAKCREGMQEPISFDLASKRNHLEGAQVTLNRKIWKDILERLFAQEGIRESFLQAFVLSRALYLTEVETNPTLMKGFDTSAERSNAIQSGILVAFAKDVLKLLSGAEKESSAPVLTDIPPRAPGEPQMSLAQLSKHRALQAKGR